MGKKKGNEKSAKENVRERINPIKLDPMNFKNMDGTITDKSDYNSLRNICIITEDRGNGFQFILSYILQNYPEMSGMVIGATGKDSFRYVLDDYGDYETYIFVVDRGISDKEFEQVKATLSEFKKSKKDVTIYIFQPKCMEEVWLSFYRLNEYIKPNNSLDAIKLQSELRKVLNGDIEKIDYSDYKTLQASTPEKICEKLIYELTDGTPFKCYHGQKEIKGVQPRKDAYLSPCWRCTCCTVATHDKLNYVKIEDCKKPKIEGNKMDYIARYSLLCGLTYILDKIYGFRYHSNGYWHNMKKSYLDELVKEF